MTPVGDIEIEVIVRIALRGRTSDVARLLEAIHTAEAVLIGIVEKPTAAEEQRQIVVSTIVGGLSG